MCDEEKKKYIRLEKVFRFCFCWYLVTWWALYIIGANTSRALVYIFFFFFGSAREIGCRLRLLWTFHVYACLYVTREKKKKNWNKKPLRWICGVRSNRLSDKKFVCPSGKLLAYDTRKRKKKRAKLYIPLFGNSKLTCSKPFFPSSKKNSRWFLFEIKRYTC